LQQRLHEPLGHGASQLLRVRGHQVQPGRPQQRHGRGHRCRGELDVGVDEDEHAAGGSLGEPLAGPRLTQPALGRCVRAAVQQGEPRVAADDRPHDVGRAVAGAVVQHQDLEVADPLLGQQRAQARRDPRSLVAYGQQHGDPLGDRRRVGGGHPQPSQVQRGVHGAGDRGRRPGRDEHGGQSRPDHNAQA
jgi:hypothetical protein